MFPLTLLANNLNGSSALVLDMSPTAPAYDVELWSDSLGQWFDFANGRFSAAPAGRRGQAVAVTGNPYRRDAAIPILPPGDYRAYSFPRSAAIGADFDEVLAFSVAADTPPPVVTVTVTQPR